MKELELAAELLRDGEISFDEFYRKTRFYWAALSRKVLAGVKWPIPTDVTAEDVEQVMLMAAWQAIGKFDASRGVSFKRYIVWVAADQGKKWIHTKRNAKRRHGDQPSRFPGLYEDLSINGYVGTSTASKGTMKRAARCGLDGMAVVSQPVADTVLEVISSVNLAITQCRRQDPKSAVALQVLRESKLDLELAASQLVQQGQCDGDKVARRLIKTAVANYV